MSTSTKLRTIFFILLVVSFQFLTVTVNSSATFNSVHGNDDDYDWFWNALVGAPGPISGEDTVFWGEDLGPYHNYTELTNKLHHLNTIVPEIVDVFSIGQSYQGREIWCVRLTNESASTAKTEFYVVGAHHAREMISVESCLYFIDYIVAQALGGDFKNLLTNSEIYIIPMLNPDGISIMHFFPEQRKNLHPIDDDEDGLNDTNSDGFLDDELERVYIWNETLNTSEVVEYDYDGDLQIANDLPGGVDLNRNYAAFWNGTGSSTDKISPLYRGEFPFSEVETQVLRDFMREHSFNFAVSLHSGIKAIIPPWGYNGTLPLKDETEFNALLGELKTTLSYPLWNETANYTANGVWVDYCYANHDIIGFTFEIFEAPWTGVWFDYFNPAGSSILSVCEQVYEGLIYLANEPRLTYTNNLPTLEVTNPSTINQVFDDYTIRWTMSDNDGDPLNCSVFVSTDGLHWDILGTNLLETTSLFWDLEGVEPGSYYIKVAAYDGKDWIADTNEIKLNVNKEVEGSRLAFWLLAGIFGGLGTIYLFFNIRKSKGVSKIWGPDPYVEDKKRD